MDDTLDEKIGEFIKPLILEYHSKLLAGLRELKLSGVIKRKNPYLFRAKGVNTAHEIIKLILDAYLSQRRRLSLAGCWRSWRFLLAGSDFGISYPEIPIFTPILSNPWAMGPSDALKNLRGNTTR